MAGSIPVAKVKALGSTLQSQLPLSYKKGRKMEIYDVVKKLIGEIKPIGETYEDDRRFKNLKVLTDLTDKLLTDIDQISYQEKDRVEYSRKQAGKFADEFLTQIGIKN